MRRTPQKVPIAERFWSKVNRNGPVPEHLPHLGKCWVWIASTSAIGYGQFWFDNAMVPAHRVAWYLEHGQRPTLFVLHKCDNRQCVRPSHLFEGTQLANIADRHAKGRTVMPHQIGTDHYNALLDEDKVRKILHLLKIGRAQSFVAKMFSVTRSCILQIHLGHTWKHVRRE